MRNIFIIGLTPYAHNRGVSAILSATIKLLKSVYPDCQITIWGGYPEPDLPIPTSLEYKKFKSYVKYVKNNVWDLDPRRQMLWMPFRILSLLTRGKFPRDPVIKWLVKSDLVLSFNYGDIFSDVHSIFNVAVILRNIIPIIAGKRIIFAPQTIGPFRRRYIEILAKIILNNSRVIAVMPRDPMSYEWLKNNLRNKSKIIFSPDMAVLLKPSDIPAVITPEVLKTGYIAVVLNPYQVPAEYYKITVEILGRVLSDIIDQTNKYIVFVPHATAEGFDCRDMARDISEYIKKKDKLIFINEDVYTAEELKSIIVNSDILISFLTHPIIAALSFGVPAIGISSRSPKMRPIMHLYGMSDYTLLLHEILDRPYILRDKIMELLNPEVREKLSTMLKNRQQLMEQLVAERFKRVLRHADC